jgi:hypothetical protein
MSSPEDLRQLIMSPGFRQWYDKQVLLARALRAGLRRRYMRAIAGEMPIELPESEEIVHETIVRVQEAAKIATETDQTARELLIRRVKERHYRHENYVCDGTCSFALFFARCLTRTLHSLRDTERRQRAGNQGLDPEVNLFLGTPHLDGRETVERLDDDMATDQSKQVLATAIAETRMSGRIKDYADRLPNYATHKSTTNEIAEDLGVKPGSIAPYRKRISRLLKKPVNE